MPANVGADGAGPALGRHMHRVLQADVQGHGVHVLAGLEGLPGCIVVEQPAPVLLDGLGGQHAQRRGLSCSCQPAAQPESVQ